MKNLVRQKADNLTLPAPYAVTSGQGAQIGAAIFGVASTDAASGAPCVFVRRGEFTLTKVGSQAWVIGDRLYWDNTNKRLTTVSSGNLQVGVATAAVGSGAGETSGQIALGVQTA